MKVSRKSSRLNEVRSYQYLSGPKILSQLLGLSEGKLFKSRTYYSKVLDLLMNFMYLSHCLSHSKILHYN